MNLKIGEKFESRYPAHNLIGIPLEWVRVRLMVSDVQDLSEERISPEDWLQQPFLRRGTLLITGGDLDLLRPTTIYLDACRGHDLPTFRLGLYFPWDSAIDWIGREYEPTRWDRRAMAEEIQRFNRWLAANPESEMRLGIYPGEKITA